MVWEDKLYVDTVLLFGLRSAPAIFNALAEALAYVMRVRGVKWLDNYLDDCIVVGSPKSSECHEGLQVALETCGLINPLIHHITPHLRLFVQLNHPTLLLSLVLPPWSKLIGPVHSLP